jgi:hypothetical protein
MSFFVYLGFVCIIHKEVIEERKVLCIRVSYLK